MAKLSFLGAGGWAMALALCAHANGHTVTLWSPFEEEVELLRVKRTNEKLLKGIVLPDEIEITTDMSVCEGSLITVVATPSFAVRETAKKLKSVKNPGIITNVSKGLESGTLLRLSQVIKEELPDQPVAVLSGPSHAEEVARKIPTMVVASSDDESAAKTVQKAFSNEFFRVYTNDDMIGVELGGALKNIIAVASGVCDGIGLGDNSKAALITRGVAEMARLGMAMGANALTFAGLAGIGDLVVTCTSVHSRNHRFGTLVGGGTPVDKALTAVGTVEGYYATKLAYELSKRFEVTMPIVEQCYELLYRGKPANDIVKKLMTRPFKEE